MYGYGGGHGEWLDQAGFTLQAAADMLVGGLSEDAITSAFLAMIFAARAALGDAGTEFSSWEEVVEVFQRDVLPRLSLSKENQRALPMVAELYRQVGGGRMDADPVTAAACLEDARSFVAEVEGKLAGGSPEEDCGPGGSVSGLNSS